MPVKNPSLIHYGVQKAECSTETGEDSTVRQLRQSCSLSTHSPCSEGVSLATGEQTQREEILKIFIFSQLLCPDRGCVSAHMW